MDGLISKILVHSSLYEGGNEYLDCKTMKVTLPTEGFVIKPCEIAGDNCYLVTPAHIGCKWEKRTLIFRSSIWNRQGEPVSLSFKKFFNWGEQPDLAHTPFSLTANGGCELMEKIDGSTLIISKYKGQVIVRTRGTTDATTLKNGYEIEILKKKYPNVFNFCKDKDGFNPDTFGGSMIYEWVSPVNKIVINYGDEPELYLTGIIHHSDYTLWSQKDLDEFAIWLGVKRPQHFNFASIQEMLEGVEKLQGQEGLCVYCNKGQDIRKVKSAWYLALHSLKSNLTTDKLAEMWFVWGKPEYEEYCKKFQETFDFECLKFAQKGISLLFDGIREYIGIMNHIGVLYEENKHLCRKDYAIKMQSGYGKEV